MAVDLLNIGSTLGGTIKLVIYLMIGAVVLVGTFFFGKKYKEKKAFNIPVTIFIHVQIIRQGILYMRLVVTLSQHQLVELLHLD